MLIIHRRQTETLHQAALRDFEDQTVSHLYQFAPRHCEVIGEQYVRETIRLGIKRSKTHGLTNRGPVRFYIELMFMFGSAFDTDPLLPWAKETLVHQKIDDQMDRAEQLYMKMGEYLKAVAGPNNMFAVAALQNVRERADQLLSFSTESFEKEMLREIQQIYPQKYTFVGTQSLRTLIQKGLESATMYSFSQRRGSELFVVLMFALGHGFSVDPLFPWVTRTLTDPKITSPDKRARRLEAKAVVYLDHVLAYLRQR